jgi:heme-degrading monooxygenase HmoA
VAIGGVAGAGAGKVTAFEGEAPKRATLQVWDSLEQYQAYRNSAAFKEVLQIGDKYAKFHTFSVDGVTP